MIISSEIANLLAKLQMRISSDEKELSDLPCGRLTQVKYRGAPYTEVVSYEAGKRIRHMVPIDSNETNDLLRKMVLAQQLEELKHNEIVLKRAMDRLVETTNYDRMTKLIAKFSAIPQEQLTRALAGPNCKSDWESQGFEQLAYMPENKRQITSRGLYVRSKSELLIAEILYEYKIPFRYEQVLHIGNITLAPDFTLRRADGKLIYWEHMGLTNSAEYRSRQIRKLQMYVENDITPWNNLIISYDNEQGNIDIRMIKAEIENKILL